MTFITKPSLFNMLTHAGYGHNKADLYSYLDKHSGDLLVALFSDLPKSLWRGEFVKLTWKQILSFLNLKAGAYRSQRR